MKKLIAVAAIAASLMPAVAAAAAPAHSSASILSVAPASENVDSTNKLAGVSNWAWLLGTVAVVVGILALTGGEETDTPVSP